MRLRHFYRPLRSAWSPIAATAALFAGAFLPVNARATYLAPGTCSTSVDPHASGKLRAGQIFFDPDVNSNGNASYGVQSFQLDVQYPGLSLHVIRCPSSASALTP